jgi:hypothetical protein
MVRSPAEQVFSLRMFMPDLGPVSDYRGASALAGLTISEV